MYAWPPSPYLRKPSNKPRTLNRAVNTQATNATARQLAPFAAMSASYFAHIGFFNPYLPLWLKDLGLSLITISLLITIQSITRIVAPYGWGWLSDHTGERVKLMRYGATMALIGSLGLWFNWGTWWFAFILLIMFSHTSAMMPMSEAAMAHLVSSSGSFDTKRYGRVRLFGSIGFLVTVLASGAWFEKYGMQDFPAWSTFTLLAVTIAVWLLPNHKESRHAHEVNEPIWPILQERKVQWFFAALFFHVISHISLYIFFSLYCDQLGYSKATIGVLWAISIAVEIYWFFSQSRWLPAISLPAWLMVCSAVMVLRTGITATSATVFALLVFAQMLHAITFATHHTACIAMLSQHFPGRQRGRGQALYTVIGYGLTGFIGGVGGGFISTKYGLSSVFYTSIATSLIALVCAYQVYKQHQT
jgi:PPP family 3-phenylpropionic acid transporter